MRRRDPVSTDSPREVASRVREWSAVAAAGLPVPVERWLGELRGSSPLQLGIVCVLRVARESGAPLAEVLVGLANGAERAAEQTDRIEQALAGPRMARRIIWALPLLAIPLTALLGFDVIAVLSATPLGWVLIALAAALTWAGSHWSNAMVVRAQRAPAAPGLYPRLLSVALASGAGLTRARSLVATVVADCGALEMLEPVEITKCDEVITLSRRSGIPLRGLLVALDARAVDRAFHASTMRARELGEKLLIPLGACTLPAFLCLGVVPAIASVVSDTHLGF